MAAKRNRDIEKVYSTRQFVMKLRRLADALEAGKPFAIQVAGESIRVPDDAVFNVEHERDGANEEVEFQLKWKRAAQAPMKPRGAGKKGAGKKGAGKKGAGKKGAGKKKVPASSLATYE